MLYTIAIMLMILWLLGMMTGIAGSFIHILLFLAVVAFLIRLISGKKPVV